MEVFLLIQASSSTGFLVSARAGSGLVIARLEDGGWSAPSAISSAGMVNFHSKPN